MLLTRKATGVAAAHSRLIRPVSGMLGKTVDRRTFLKRSGITLGAGAVASQLPFNIVTDAPAADQPAAGKIEVKRTVCALLGGLLDRRGRAERCVDPPGAGVRLTPQPGRALRQRRVD